MLRVLEFIRQLVDETIQHETGAQRVEVVAQNGVGGWLVYNLDDDSHHRKGFLSLHEWDGRQCDGYLCFVVHRVPQLLKQIVEDRQLLRFEQIRDKALNDLVSDVVLVLGNGLIDQVDKQPDSRVPSKEAPFAVRLDTSQLLFVARADESVRFGRLVASVIG